VPLEIPHLYFTCFVKFPSSPTHAKLQVMVPKFLSIILSTFLFIFSTVTTTKAFCYPAITGGCGLNVACPDGTCCTDVAECRLPVTCTTVSGGTGINSAIGCINVSSLSGFTGWLLTWGIGVAGGIALLLILYSAFLITTSAGDPKKLQAGQEQLTSAVTGLVLVIFSIFILKVIGVDIFKLPGFLP